MYWYLMFMNFFIFMFDLKLVFVIIKFLGLINLRVIWFVMIDEFLWVILVKGLVCINMGVFFRVCIKVGWIVFFIRIVSVFLMFKLLVVMGFFLWLVFIIMLFNCFFMLFIEVVRVRIVMILFVIVILKLVFLVIFFLFGFCFIVIFWRKWLLILRICFYVMSFGLRFSCINFFIFLGVRLLGLVLLIFSFFNCLNMIFVNECFLFLLVGYNLFRRVLFDWVVLWNIWVLIVVVNKLLVVVMVCILFVVYK